MNYWNELMHLAQELKLTTCPSHYYSHLMRSDVRDTHFLHVNGDGQFMLIATATDYREHVYNSEQSIIAALKALHDYASWN